MSLISDALKTAQRERANQKQAAKGPQPLLDGFFPYVASTPPRSRSRRTPILAVAGAGIGLLAIVAWLAWSKPTKVAPQPVRNPAVVPPPAPVTAAAKADSSVGADTLTVGATAEGVGPTASSRESRRSSPPRASSTASAPAQTTGTLRTIEPVSTSRVADRADDTPSRAPAPRSEPPARVDYEAQATALFNAGDLTGAREKFQLATRFGPTARVWTNYGVTLQRLGDYSGANAAYQSAIGIDANYLEAWLYQGRLAAYLGDVTRATPLFERARSINPRNAAVNIELARLEYEAKNWTETRRFAEEAVRSEPANPRGHWYVAVASDELKDVDAAVRAYTSYLQTVGGAEREQAEFVGWARTRLAILRGKP